MFCSNCGCELTGSKKFCTNCGKPQAQAQIRPAAQAPSRPAAQAPSRPTVQAPSRPTVQAPSRPTAQAPVRNVELKAGPNYWWIAMDIYWLLLSFNSLTLGIVMVPIVLARGGSSGEVLGALIFSLFFLAGFVVHVAIGLVVLALVIVTVRVSGRTLTIRKLFTKREYDCSDIVKIECLTFGYRRVCTINLTFKDGKTFRLGKNAAHAKEFAACLLDLLRAGAIPQTAIVYEHAQRLVMTTEGKSWENLSGYGWKRRGN